MDLIITLSLFVLVVIFIKIIKTPTYKINLIRPEEKAHLEKLKDINRAKQ